MMMRDPLALLVACSVALIAPSAGWAQRPDLAQRQQAFAANRMTTSVAGTLEGMQGRLLHIKGEDDRDYLVQAPEELEKIRFTGTALPAWLGRGMFVRFEAPFDASGRAVAPVAQLEVFTPNPGRRPDPAQLAEITPGIYPVATGGGADLFEQGDRPRRPAAQSATYKIIGRVGSINRKGMLTVAAGPRPVQVEVAPEANVSVNLLGWQAARQGDHVQVEGFYLPPNETRVLAESIRITAAGTLGEPATEEEAGGRRGGRAGPANRRGAARGEDAPAKPASEAEEAAAQRKAAP